MILARFGAPEADEGYGVDEVDGGGANRSNFVLLGKILPFKIPHRVTHHHHLYS
jgi:hypothetical protein